MCFQWFHSHTIPPVVLRLGAYIYCFLRVRIFGTSSCHRAGSSAGFRSRALFIVHESGHLHTSALQLEGRFSGSEFSRPNSQACMFDTASMPGCLCSNPASHCWGLPSNSHPVVFLRQTVGSFPSGRVCGNQLMLIRLSLLPTPTK